MIGSSVNERNNDCIDESYCPLVSENLNLNQLEDPIICRQKKVFYFCCFYFQPTILLSVYIVNVILKIQIIFYDNSIFNFWNKITILNLIRDIHVNEIKIKYLMTLCI